METKEKEHQPASASSPAMNNADAVFPPIAIVGMAMRLPGGINSGEEMWDFLVNKKDARTRVPANRYNIDAFHGPGNKTLRIVPEHGYFLEDTNLQHFDPSLFSMTLNELNSLDPQQRQLLEVTRECLENAGQTQWRGENVGCYIGSFGEDWLDLQSKDTLGTDMYQAIGSGDFSLANRISYEYDLKGPSLTIRTACSSSLVCLHTACEALAANRISSALVGGSSLIMSPTMTMSFGNVLSPNGSCKTFDAEADGFARGEGINMLYIKRLDDAVRAGDVVRAVIRGTSINSDGKSIGIGRPNAEAHEALIRQAYKVAGLRDYGQTAFFECHGTGTPIGDPIETLAVVKVFGERGIYIGSVKPNLGHSEGASGLTSVIKAVLALENKTIPPNIKFNKPNPNILFEEAKLRVPTEAIPWPEDRHERVSVNSFGIGGANAHVIIDSAASFAPGEIQSHPLSQGELPSKPGEPRLHLLVTSASHIVSAQNGTTNYAEYLEKFPGHLRDLAYTLGTRREHLPYRSFAVTDGTSTAEFCAPSKAPSGRTSLAFVFTGQGAQWATMGTGLLAIFPSVRQDFRAMDIALGRLPKSVRPTWSIEGELSSAEEHSRLSQAEFSQPLCTALQLALVNLLRDWNIEPASVVGHSNGEIAAAYTCGGLSLSEAIIVAYLRGQVTKHQTRRGAMAAIGLGAEDVVSYLVEGVVLACENSPESTTLSGDEGPLDEVLQRIKEARPDVLARRLKVDKSYHSHHMREIGEEYETLLQPYISGAQPTILFFSSVLGQLLNTNEKQPFDAAYWRQNLEEPVLFHAAVKSLLSVETGNKLLLEIGPHSVLQGPLRQIFRASQFDAAYIPTLARGQDDAKSMLATAGRLFLGGISIDLGAINTAGNLLTNIPRYPWHHEQDYWSESRFAKEWRLRQFPHHDLLGSRIVEVDTIEPTWRNMLRLDDVPWLRDHTICSDIVFPAVGYMAMAGEAIRQLTGTDDYSLRQVSIPTALMLKESSVTETMFHLRPVPLTIELDSVWHEYSVLSHNGTAWVKHCTGQVRAGQEHLHSPVETPKLPRRVPSARWYQAMERVGLEYGPSFQGLEDISAHPVDGTATATICTTANGHDSHYQLHPSTMDCCLQLFAVAMSKGQPRDLKSLSVPVYFGEIHVAKGSEVVKVHVTEGISGAGTRAKECVAVSADKVVFLARDMKLSQLEVQDRDRDPHAAARLVWKPDIDLLDKSRWIFLHEPANLPIPITHKLIQKLVLLVMSVLLPRLAVIEPPLDHLRTYRSWIEVELHKAESEGYELVDDAKDLLALGSADRVTLIHQVSNEISQMEMVNARQAGRAYMRAIAGVFEVGEQIFRGELDPLAPLFRDGLAKTLYDNYAYLWNLKPFLTLFCHSKPGLKILEIGSGTGATTARVLEDLDITSSENKGRSFYSYTFTDISPAFLTSAKERFRDVPSMIYSVLDINKDPVEQGFVLESYDLIIASNVVHATPNIGTTLRNIQKLLDPKGKLLLQEIFPKYKALNFVMGVLPGWWLGEADGRLAEPYIGIERWKLELSMASFSSPEVITYNSEWDFAAGATIIVSPESKRTTTARENKRVTLLTHARSSASTATIAAAFENLGLVVDFSTLSEPPRPNQDVVSLLDLDDDRSFIADINAANYELLKAYLLSIMNNTRTGMLWLTRSIQMESLDPNYAQILGFARTVRSELAIAMATVEIDSPTSQTTVDAILQVFGTFQQRSNESALDPDYEYALSRGVIYIPRFYRVSVFDELISEAQENARRQLEIGKPGSLQTLRWEQQAPVVLGKNEIAINVRAVGLNFRDVLVALGVVNNVVGETGFGLEASGVVTELGPEVETFKIGDRVLALAPAVLTDVLKADVRACLRMPDWLSFEEGATIPSVYATVCHSLLEVARLERNQSILIHSACGGVGIAAINICKMIGAKIFTSVSSSEKVQYLMDAFNIPRHHIFHSRSSSFLVDIMRVTNGQGVDVVLNSLSGDLLHASWKCVAPYGKMLEIGKRDFLGHGQLAMDKFSHNRSFFGIDLSTILERTALGSKMHTRLLKNVERLLEHGKLPPIRPMIEFDAEKVEDAFRYMLKGQHMGKIVIKMPEDRSKLPAEKSRARAILRSDVSYLLVGGFGGVGQSISSWMVEHGAKHLIYLSRSGGSGPDDIAFTEDLQAQGCKVQIFKGDVTNLVDVQNTKDKANTPVAGIIQMAMVLKDQAFEKMTYEDWESATAPKVKGTWNLHHTFAAENLDFFVLLSSLSGVIGRVGQANYAAANTFLDAFSQFRHRYGMKASVMQIGILGDIGYVSRNDKLGNHWREQGMHTLHEQDFLDCLELSISNSSLSTSVDDAYVDNSLLSAGLRIYSQVNRAPLTRDIRMPLYRSLEDLDKGEGISASKELRDFLTLAASRPEIFLENSSVEFLAKEIGTRLFSFMIKPIEEMDIKVSLLDLAVDSMVAIEMRNWFHSSFKVDLTILEISGAATIEDLGQTLAQKLLKKYGSVESESQAVDVKPPGLG